MDHLSPKERESRARRWLHHNTSPKTRAALCALEFHSKDRGRLTATAILKAKSSKDTIGNYLNDAVSSILADCDETYAVVSHADNRYFVNSVGREAVRMILGDDRVAGARQ